MKEIKVDTNFCCGCGVCVLMCPKKCLQMRESKTGFSYPYLVNVENCIHCNICEKMCDFNSEKRITDEKTSYIAASKNKEILYKSSSGGLFYQLGKYFLNNNGIVYGAALLHLKVKHIRIDNIEQLDLLLGSKYVESELGNIFLKIKNDLLLCRKVLFAGTGCQVNALRKFIGSNQNLFLFEILCHGVPSKKLFNLFLKDFEKKHSVIVNDVEFRSKEKHGWTPPTMNIFTNKRKYSDTAYFYSFNRGFGLRYFNRSSCFKCPYTYLTTKADIIVGDYWNPEEQFYDSLGMSFVILKSDQAEYYFNKVTSELHYESIEINKLIEGNTKLIKPSKKPNEYDCFWNDFNNDFIYEKLVRKYKINLKTTEKIIKKIDLIIKDSKKKCCD